MFATREEWVKTEHYNYPVFAMPTGSAKILHYNYPLFARSGGSVKRERTEPMVIACKMDG